jgi:hypothetical protein
MVLIRIFKAKYDSFLKFKRKKSDPIADRYVLKATARFGRHLEKQRHSKNDQHKNNTLKTEPLANLSFVF